MMRASLNGKVGAEAAGSARNRTSIPASGCASDKHKVHHSSNGEPDVHFKEFATLIPAINQSESEHHHAPKRRSKRCDQGDGKRMIAEGNCGYGREDAARQPGQQNGNQYLDRRCFPGHKSTCAQPCLAFIRHLLLTPTFAWCRSTILNRAPGTPRLRPLLGTSHKRQNGDNGANSDASISSRICARADRYARDRQMLRRRTGFTGAS